jgi:hypothetical protein
MVCTRLPFIDARGLAVRQSEAQQAVPDAVVNAMTVCAGAQVAQRGQDKHPHYSPGVTVEEMRRDGPPMIVARGWARSRDRGSGVSIECPEVTRRARRAAGAIVTKSML